MKKIEFFFDIISPYSYLAATQVDAFAQKVGVDLEWIPFLIGGVLKETGNRPNIAVPAKGKYLLRDLSRWSAYYQIPLQFPSDFPKSTVLVQRILTALPTEQRSEIAMKFFEAHWVKDEDITQTEILAPIVGQEAIENALTPENKERLKENTAEAIQRGAFGAPTFFIGEEMFWGADRFVLMEEYLQQIK